MLPELLTTDTIDLGGIELRVIKIGRADTADSTLLHVPSLRAVVAGDLVYNEVHMMTAEAGQVELADWIDNLDKVAALEPSVVVAGHKKVENDNDPKRIGESQQYLWDFSRIAAEETTTAGVVARMVERYPGWQNPRTLWYSAASAIKPEAQSMSLPSKSSDASSTRRSLSARATNATQQLSQRKVLADRRARNDR